MPFSPPFRLHVAKWVLPGGNLPVIENGAVATFGGKIVKVGGARELKASLHADGVVDHGEAILSPALVNAHCHLELSPLKWRLTPSGSFAAWVQALIRAREDVAPSEWLPAAKAAATELWRSGTGILGDVGNNGLSREALALADAPKLRGIFYREVIAPMADTAPSFDEQPSPSPSLRMRSAVAAHAVYSVAPEVIRAVKQWDLDHGLPFSIHVAESGDETEFLQTGGGPIRDLLAQRGHWPLRHKIPQTTAVRFLDGLGVLDSTTLCVHCVQVDDGDIEILAQRRATVCLCPRSNIFLGVGIPPAARLHEAGVALALGTDSLASNDRLSIFAEMASLADLAPELPPQVIIEAATSGGARALGLAAQRGTLEPGKAAHLVALQASGVRDGDVLDFFIHAGSLETFELYHIDEEDTHELTA